MDIAANDGRGNVVNLLVPNAEAMRQHLEHLFGGDLDGHHNGLIELAWTDTFPGKDGKYRLRHASLYGTDQLEELIEEAVRRNSIEYCNVYIGAALRHPNTPPFGRASDGDVLALSCAYVDLDDDGAAARAVAIYNKDKPTLVVVTGRAPYTRAQCWWRLEEPVTDTDELRTMLKGMAVTLGGDETVVNPSRVMRLAGSIAWAQKPGRQVELTHIVPIREPTHTAYAVPELMRRFPAPPDLVSQFSEISEIGQTGQTGQPGRAPNAPFVQDGVIREQTQIGLPGRVIDHRDVYLRNTVEAVLIQLIGETGQVPSPQQLINAVWVQYSAQADLNKAGKGIEAVIAKCNYAIKRFQAGKISGCRNMMQAQAIYARKKANGGIRPLAVLPPAPLYQGIDPNDFDTEPARPLILTAEQFVAGFTPPAYLIDGILQRGYLYSLTARTGHGKTAIAMYIAQCVARGQMMHGCPVMKGTVLLLAGENPDDIRARFMVMAEVHGFHAETLKMRFVAGIVDVASSLPEIRAVAAEIEDLVLVIVDTAAAYFPGDEVNSNSQQGAYARLLRELTFLPGKPACVVNCHPTKNAQRDNLLPMGGSAFLNEVDGNLTLWSNSEKHVTLHWQGKFRGPEFSPMSFEIVVGQSERVKDARDRLMPNAVAKPMSDEDLAQAEKANVSDEDRMLKEMYRSYRASLADIACRLGFGKTKAHRMATNLKNDRLIVMHRNRYELTPKGEKEIGVGSRDDDGTEGFG